MDEFELLIDQAKELLKAFPDLEFKTIAALTLIIGWLLTAENAQIFLVAHSTISMVGSVVAMGSFAIVQAIFLWGHYSKISRVHAQLEKLAAKRDFSSVLVNIYKVSPFLPISYAFINLIFCLAIIVLVCVIGQA